MINQSATTFEIFSDFKTNERLTGIIRDIIKTPDVGPQTIQIKIFVLFCLTCSS